MSVDGSLGRASDSDRAGRPAVVHWLGHRPEQSGRQNKKSLQGRRAGISNLYAGVFLLGLSVVLCDAGVLSASLLRRIVLILPVLLAVVILFTRSRTKHRK